MRKLFRMQYEPCSGACYAWNEVLPLHSMDLSVDETQQLLDKIIGIHEVACGNKQIGYGLDLDEGSGIFIASFSHYGTLDLFHSSIAYGALVQLIDAVNAWVTTRPDELSTHPGLGHVVCEHGEDPDLRAFALAWSGLSKSEIEEINNEDARPSFP